MNEIAEKPEPPKLKVLPAFPNDQSTIDISGNSRSGSSFKLGWDSTIEPQRYAVKICIF